MPGMVSLALPAVAKTEGATIAPTVIRPPKPRLRPIQNTTSASFRHMEDPLYVDASILQRIARPCRKMKVKMLRDPETA